MKNLFKISTLLKKLCIHGDFQWQKPNGSPIPLVISIPPEKQIEIVRVCGKCGEKLTQRWGNVRGEILKDW